jgi:predicted nucleic acid-binding protein
MAKVLVDTGVLYAMADEDDSWHERTRTWLRARRDDLVVPVTVLPEACYLLNAHLGAPSERALVESVRSREFSLEPVAVADLSRIAELLNEYEDANIGFVDASVIALAERLRIRRVLTTDRRHFSAIRPRHCPALELLP